MYKFITLVYNKRCSRVSNKGLSILEQKMLIKNQENQIKDCKIWSITKDGNRNTKVSNIGL